LGGQAIPLGFAPPARAGQGKTPQDGLIFMQENDLVSSCAILEGGEFKGGIGQGRRVGEGDRWSDNSLAHFFLGWQSELNVGRTLLI
jgi:hypothetical protein